MSEVGVQAVGMGLVELDDTSEDELTLVGGKEKTVCNINVELHPEQKNDLRKLIELYPDVLSDVPGNTDTVVHKITLNSSIPVFKKPYTVPTHLRNVVEEEVTRMLEMGIIGPSSSPYCSPVVLVKKGDGSYRLCIDFRFLNDITQFDAEPMPNREDHLDQFTNERYFTELDLCKGYWQMKLAPESKIYTAFPTSQGLMQFTQMPFGLKTACASFVRLMKIVLRGLQNTCCYFDNIVIHNKDWKSHIRDVQCDLDRLRDHGLTAGPKKCFLGYQSISYLGYSLGHNIIRPLEDKVTAIREINLPTTKSQLRSFLRSVNFYGKFIPNMSALTGPLSDLLKKNCSNHIPWTPPLEEKFYELRDAFTKEPILMLPNSDKSFYLRTDASNDGLGAVILQEVDGDLRPVSYGSRKLLDRERSYSTIEKEGLALVCGM